MREGSALLRFAYVDDDRTLIKLGFKFDRVRSQRFTADGNWRFVAEAYSTLIEIQESELVDDLVAASLYPEPERWPTKHFMIYFDEVGCYEFVAASWSWLGDQPVD